MSKEEKTMKTIDVCQWPAEKWDEVETLFDGVDESVAAILTTLGIDGFAAVDDEDYDDAEEAAFDWLHNNSTVLAKFEDNWGWDYLYQLPSGQLVFPDRNSGIHSFTNTLREDIVDFLLTD